MEKTSIGTRMKFEREVRDLERKAGVQLCELLERDLLTGEINPQQAHTIAEHANILDFSDEEINEERYKDLISLAKTYIS